MIARLLPRLAVALILVVAAGCDEDPCSINEMLRLRVAGSCADGPRELVLIRTGCALRVGQQSGPVGLPIEGAIDQAGHDLREGGWQLFGCADGAKCTDAAAFRRCTAVRVNWQIDLACVDATGAPVCHATLTE